MKHIGACLEGIQIALAKIPRSVESAEDKAKAFEIMDKIEAYLITLQQLTLNPALKDYLYRLEQEPVEGIRLEAHHVEELLKDLEHMLEVIFRYLQNTRVIIQAYPDQWSIRADKLTQAIDQKFGDGMGELRKEFKLIVYKEEELKRLVANEEHLTQFLG